MVVLDDVVVVVVDDFVVVVVDVVFVVDDDVVLSVVDPVVVVDVLVVDVLVVLTVTVFVVMVVEVLVDFSVVDKVLKKSPRKGRSCVEPDPVELGTTDEEVAVVVVTVASPSSLVVELTTFSMSNQVKSWFVPLLEVEASRLSVVLSYKAGFNERDSNDTTEPLLRIIEGISLSISNGNSDYKH